MRSKVSAVVLVLFTALFAHAQISVSGLGDSTVVAPVGGPERANGQNSVGLSGSISGTAAALDGSPLADCRIELHDAERGVVLADTRTGRSGRFEFRNVADGRYDVVAISGLEQTHETVQVLHSQATVDLRLNSQEAEKAQSGTVSVAEFKVPEKARREWTKGEQALFKNKLSDARKHADRALQIAPHYAQALTLRGILKLGSDDVQGGVADLQQAIKNDANYAMGYIALGAGLNAQRQFNEAERTLERGMSLDPNAWQGWFELTKSQLARGDFKEALKSITRAQELNKDYPSIHLLLAHSLLGNHQYSRAIEEFELYLSQEPNSPNATWARAGLSQARSYMQSAAK